MSMLPEKRLAWLVIFKTQLSISYMTLEASELIIFEYLVAFQL